MAQQHRIMTELANVCRMLADGTHLRLLMVLSTDAKNVTTLCQELALIQATVSHHLGLLRMSQLVVSRRAGREVHYSLAPAIVPSGSKGMYGIEVNAGKGVIRLAWGDRPRRKG